MEAYLFKKKKKKEITNKGYYSSNKMWSSIIWVMFGMATNIMLKDEVDLCIYSSSSIFKTTHYEGWPHSNQDWHNTSLGIINWCWKSKLLRKPSMYILWSPNTCVINYPHWPKHQGNQVLLIYLIRSMVN